MFTRKTDSDWEKIAEAEPYFGVLSYTKFLSKNLNEGGLAEFYESGRSYVNSVLKQLKPFNTAERINRALDFGCGAGRLVIPMAKVCQHAVGIDVASNMRRITQAHANESGVHNLELYKDIDELPAHAQFDWINSYIVFQHIPPERGYAILEKLLDRLAPGGLVSLQFNLFKARPVMDAAVRDVEFFRVEGNAIKPLTVTQTDEPWASMSMFDYDMNILVAILYRHGVVDAKIRYHLEDSHFGITILGARSTEMGTKAYSLGQPISFADSAGNHSLLRKGFGAPEVWGVWTTEKTAELVLPVAIPHTQAIQLKIKARAYTPKSGGAQNVAVYVNDAKLSELQVTRGEPQEYVIQVPSQIATAQTPLKVGFTISKPVSPIEAGEGNDFRSLGLALFTIAITNSD